MANQQRLLGVNGPLTQWQNGPGTEVEQRNKDRTLQYRQQVEAIRAREREALAQLEMQFSGMQQAQAEAGASRRFAAGESQKQRDFATGENMTSRADAERNALRQQANSDRAFAEEQSQFDRNQAGGWAQAQLQAFGRGQGGGGGSGSGGGGAGGAGTQQGSAQAALAFLENDAIKSGKLDDDALPAQLAQLAMLDPQAAAMVQQYLASPIYQDQIKRGSQAAGQAFAGILPGGEKLAEQNALSRAEDAGIRLRGLLNVPVAPTAGSSMPNIDTSFLSRPSTGSRKSDGTLKAERLLGDVQKERSRLSAGGLDSEQVARLLRSGLNQNQWEQGRSQVPSAQPSAPVATATSAPAAEVSVPRASSPSPFLAPPQKIDWVAERDKLRANFAPPTVFGHGTPHTITEAEAFGVPSDSAPLPFTMGAGMQAQPDRRPDSRSLGEAARRFMEPKPLVGPMPEWLRQYRLGPGLHGRGK